MPRDTVGEISVRFDGDDTIEVESVRLSASVRGTGLCTSFLTESLRDALAKASPITGRLSIFSEYAEEAFACYVKAFNNVGYRLDSGIAPTDDPDYQRGSMWRQILIFKKKNMTDDERTRQRQRLFDFFGL